MRPWSERVEQYVLDVIFDRRHDVRAAFTRGALFLLSQLYSVGVHTRLILYRWRILRDHTLGCQVISIGNLTVGGTGKTPVVETFARALQAAGRRVAILSRGYKSAKKPLLQRIYQRITFQTPNLPPKVVSDGKSLLLDSEQAGDEPFMLATNLPNVVVLVDPDRVKSGRYAVEKFNCDTLLLDDGFQYLRLKSRMQVVLVDRTTPFGNNRMLPRGILREPRRNIRRANFIFLTKCNGSDNTALVKQLRAFNQHAEIIECTHHPLHFQNVYSAERQPLEFISGKRVGAISGIAMPEGFENRLRELGAEVVYVRRYADHHRFSQQEILNMINRSVMKGADLIITTEKDAVRFPKLDRRDLPIYYLRVEIKILRGAKDFSDAVERICLHRQSDFHENEVQPGSPVETVPK
jgi:tetraacyldisaccharide 4'-kinase